MGSFASVFQNESQPTMKVLLFVALAIAAVMAEPEAEPTPEAAPEAAADAWYGYYGYGRRWGGYPYRGYYGYYRGKRSPDAEAEPTAAAEADPEADAAADAWYGLRTSRILRIPCLRIRIWSWILRTQMGWILRIPLRQGLRLSLSWKEIC